MVSPRQQVDAVRSFNRFYTRQLGLLGENLLNTPFSLTQARVLYELAQRPGTRWTDLAAGLNLDAGYLSRLVKGFTKQGLVRRAVSQEDRRVSHLSLTALGRKAFQNLNAQSEAGIDGMLARFDAARRQQLVDHMGAIHRLLDTPGVGDASFALRTHEPGDIGWVIARHGELYAREYGWDASFEALVAEIAGKFLRSFDRARERCWIAERDGERAGCVFLVKQSRTVAKLRLLLVEPSGRGGGLGEMLVQACVEFARESGYRKITLWTNDVLHAARRIYERVGFRLAREEKHHSFGHDLVGQYWELDL